MILGSCVHTSAGLVVKPNILDLLHRLAELAPEYPPAMMEARREAFVRQIEARITATGERGTQITPDTKEKNGCTESND